MDRVKMDNYLILKKKNINVFVKGLKHYVKETINGTSIYSLDYDLKRAKLIKDEMIIIRYNILGKENEKKILKNYMKNKMSLNKINLLIKLVNAANKLPKIEKLMNNPKKYKKEIKEWREYSFKNK